MELSQIEKLALLVYELLETAGVAFTDINAVGVTLFKKTATHRIDIPADEMVQQKTQDEVVLAAANLIHKCGVHMFVPGNFDISPEEVPLWAKDPSAYYEKIGAQNLDGSPIR